MNQPNRKRGLADLVGVEAWHRAFTSEAQDAELHIDVVFGSARLGRGPDEPVRFQLSVRRAEVVVIVPSGEPVKVLPHSVVRDAPRITGSTVERQTSRRALSAGGALSTTARGALDATAAASARMETDVERTMEAARVIGAMEVLHMRNDDGDHRWILSSEGRSGLSGRPWDGSAPRLTLRDCRTDPSRGIAPTVRVEIRCLREDLEITGLAMKDERFWARLSSRPGHRNRMAAAEALIRTRLFEEGLLSLQADVSDDRLDMLLAATTAEC